MKVIRFELNIDKVVEGVAYVDNGHEVFRDEDATGKTFLFVDKVTGDKQVAYCRERATDDHKYASVQFYTIPTNAIIIDDEVKVDTTNDQVIEYIRDCRDAINKQIDAKSEKSADRYNLVMEGLKGLFDRIEEGGTSGVSEKTLLKALEIVSKSLG